MKKLILSVMVITSLFFVLSCKQSSDDSTGNGSGNNTYNSPVNGTYELIVKNNNQVQTGTIKITISNVEYDAKQGVSGKIKAIQSPKSLLQMNLSDSEFNTLLAENNISSENYYKYVNELNNLVFEFNFVEYNDYNYDCDFIPLEEKGNYLYLNIKSIFIEKNAIGEEYYYQRMIGEIPFLIKKDDFTHLYSYKDSLLVFNKK